MKAVRFKEKYAETTNGRLSYELVDDVFVREFAEMQQGNFVLRNHYNTKLLGLVPAYMMEEASDEDIPAIDVFVKLSNQ